MDILNIIISNLMATPIICFLLGILFSIFNINWLRRNKLEDQCFDTKADCSSCFGLFRPKFHSFLTYLLLFSIGLKGGEAFIKHSTNAFFLLLGIMVAWGLLQPFISYSILRKFTRIDGSTAAAIAACFGSVSVMTFAAGAAFLEKLNVPYERFVIGVLATMEVPAILSGLFLSKWKNNTRVYSRKSLWIHTLLNKTILMIFLGITVGIISHFLQLTYLTSSILIAFKPSLCLFLFNMGLLIGNQRKDLNQFSWSLTCFGFYMPFIGGIFGILLSYFLRLDPGTGTLIAVLSASASYIAVPAAMRIAIPEAKEAIYLPLSLGIAFPFNVMIGIPIYYILGLKLLS